jgi:DNA polymerase sigma
MHIAYLHSYATTQLLPVRLIDFFKHFSREFSYSVGVASIRAGLLKKESKGWSTEVSLAVLVRIAVLTASA